MGASWDGHGGPGPGGSAKDEHGRAWTWGEASEQAGKARQAGRQGKQASRQASKQASRLARQAGKQAGKAGKQGCMVGWAAGAAGTTPRLCVLKLISYYRDSAFDHRHRVGHGERVCSRESAKLRCLLRRRSRCSRRGTWLSEGGAGASTSWAQGGALAIWTGGLDWTRTGLDGTWTGLDAGQLLERTVGLG